MKKILLLSALTVSVSFGQITLTDQHFAGASESFIFSTLLDLNVDYSTTGSNMTWDFSTLTPTSQLGLLTRPMSEASSFSQLFFGSFAPTPYKATYFASTTDLPIDQLTANLPVTIEDVSQFTKKTTSAITSLGYEFILNGQGIAAKSDTIETRYALPLNFGDTYNSHGFTDLDMNPIYDAKWNQHRYRESNVDGYGTVITPYGTFSALRIHHRILETDSVYLSISGTGFWVPIPIPETHEYEWRAVEDHEAVMRITTNVVLGTETVTNVEYRDNYNGLGFENQSVTVGLGPNPAIENLTVNTSSELQQIMVVDGKGAVLVRVSASGTTHLLDISALAAGTYTVVVATQAGINSSKFVKQ